MADAPDDDAALRALVVALDRRSLRTTARFVVDMVAPFGVVAGSLVQFAQPFLAHARWRAAVEPLAHERGWNQLQRLLADADD